MTPVIVALFDDYGIADRVRTELVADGFPTDRVELTSLMEPGQADMLGSLGRTRRPILVLADLDPRPSRDRRIKDPVDQPRLVFAECYDRVGRCLAEFVNTIWGGRTT